MAAVAAGAAIVGAGVQIYGQLKAASAQADAQEREAELKMFQADELMRRQAINEQVMRDNVAEAELATGGDSGVEDTGLGARMRLRKTLAQNLQNSRREAEWKARMLGMGAEADLRLASDALAAGGISAIGTGIRGAGAFANYYDNAGPPDSTTKELGKVKR